MTFVCLGLVFWFRVFFIQTESSESTKEQKMMVTKKVIADKLVIILFCSSVMEFIQDP